MATDIAITMKHMLHYTQLFNGLFVHCTFVDIRLEKLLTVLVVSNNIFVASMLGVSSNIFVASILGIGSGNVLGLSKFVMGGSTGVIVEFIVFIAVKAKKEI